MFGKKKNKIEESNTEEIVETVDAVKDDTTDASSADAKDSGDNNAKDKKPMSDTTKAINAWVGNNVGMILVVLASFAMLMAGLKLQDMAKENLTVANREVAQATNDLTGVQTVVENITQQRTVINRRVTGIDEARHASDDKLFYGWIADAFNFNGYEEYNEHRQKYVDQLGVTNRFVRVIMPVVTFDESLQAEIERYNTTLNMSVVVDGDNSGFKSYVRGIDEETGTYSYIATVSVRSQNGRGATSSAAGSPIMLYDINLDADGNAVIDYDSFVCYIPSSLYK